LQIRKKYFAHPKKVMSRVTCASSQPASEFVSAGADNPITLGSPILVPRATILLTCGRDRELCPELIF